ncbi:MAG: OsmC family peroxiredoxin [Bacteroidota bacterium]
MATVKSTYTGNLRTEATHLQSGTKLITDAPVDNQGKGEFFSPTDLVATSLGSCMITIMGIAAKTHGFNIEGASWTVTKIMADNQKYVEAVPLRRGRDIKGNSNKLISRLQSLQIVLAMMELKEVDTHLANECVTKLMRYALSIQTDKFDTPRYLRVL